MISEYLGFDSDYIILGLAAFCVILFILTVVNMAKTSKLRKKYEAFMMGKDAKSLEETLVTRLSQVDKLISANEANEKNIRKMFDNMKFTFQKVGLVKYDAFNEMGGKLSFSLAMLNERNDGYIINAMHSREGCYTYIKEVIKGESYIELSEEERDCLEKAIYQEEYDIKSSKN